MAKKSLRAVEPDEKPQPARVLSILEAAEEGDRLEELRAMRRRIAKTLDDTNTPARDLAALSRRQMELGREIEVMESQVAEEARSAESARGERRRAFNASAI